MLAQVTGFLLPNLTNGASRHAIGYTQHRAIAASVMSAAFDPSHFAHCDLPDLPGMSVACDEHHLDGLRRLVQACLIPKTCKRAFSHSSWPRQLRASYRIDFIVCNCLFAADVRNRETYTRLLCSAAPKALAQSPARRPSPSDSRLLSKEATHSVARAAHRQAQERQPKRFVRNVANQLPGSIYSSARSGADLSPPASHNVRPISWQILDGGRLSSCFSAQGPPITSAILTSPFRASRFLRCIGRSTSTPRAAGTGPGPFCGS